MLRAWRNVILVLIAMPAESLGSATPVVVMTEPAPEWNARFAGENGWVGGDAVYSVVLGPGRVAWFFGDSLIGTVKDGQRQAVMVNNTVAIQDRKRLDRPIRFVTGKSKDGKPAALFTPVDGKGSLWPQAGIRIDERLFVFMSQIEKTDDKGAFSFRYVGHWLTIVKNPDDEPEKWQEKQVKVPFADFTPGRERSWGSAVLRSGEYLYVYGYAQRGKGLGKRALTVARVPVAKLSDFTAWRFLSADGWSEKPEDATPFAEGLATEFSVSVVPGTKELILVYTQNGLGDRIVGRFAKAPEGPWSEPVLLFTCPEMAKDKALFTYAAKAHPWASEEGLLVSYCVNAHDFARLFHDEAVYRPKFVRMKLRAGR